jgi:hypothetical protein
MLTAGAVGPVSKMASQQEKVSCVLRFEVCRSVITVQREFCAWLKKEDIILMWCAYFKPRTKLTLHCNHRPARFKMGQTEQCHSDGMFMLTASI